MLTRVFHISACVELGESLSWDDISLKRHLEDVVNFCASTKGRVKMTVTMTEELKGEE